MPPAEYSSAYYYRTKDQRSAKLKQYQDTYYKKHKKDKCKRHRAWVQRNKEYCKTYQRAYNLRKLYGLSTSQFEAMKKVQDNKCSICFSEFTSDSFSYVDHNHDTGKVRGLLCSKCNLALGQFKDDQILLMNAIKYLRRYDNGNI